MDQVLDRIAAWEAAGLIDAATAERLRAAETAQAHREAGERAARQSDAQPSPTPAATHRGPSSVAAIFGPGIAIGEMFAYLGGAFVLGAFETFVVRSSSGIEGRSFLTLTIGMAVAAIALTATGLFLRRGDARRHRAAGVVFALAVVHVAAAVAAGAEGSGFGWPAVGAIGAGVATLAAFGYRLIHPSLLTQVALLASGTSFAGLLLSWLESVVVPQAVHGDFGDVVAPGGPDQIVLVVVSAIWWLGLAVIFGLVGLAEARTADEDPAAGRRASLTRLWAGLVAVLGFATAVTRQGPISAFESGRLIEPWIADLAILVLAAVLVERAFRRDASTFVYAAALALIIALTDFNFTYLSSSTEVGPADRGRHPAGCRRRRGPIAAAHRPRRARAGDRCARRPRLTPIGLVDGPVPMRHYAVTRSSQDAQPTAGPSRPSGCRPVVSLLGSGDAA